jgi:group I intron endonuclease
MNNKKYIGKAKDFNRRHREHLNSSFNANCKDYKLPIHNAIRKYGFECFEIKIIATDINSERIDELEKFFIDKYNTTNHNGYNVASGGQGGNTFLGKSNSEMVEIRKKISMSNKNKPKSTEHTKKNSESHMGLQVREKNGRAKKVKAVDETGVRG